MQDELSDSIPENPEYLEGLQISSKEGLHSSAQKLAASRSGFAPRPSEHHVSGAFSEGDRETAGSGRFRCNSCGRYFDDEPSLRIHEPECRIAKQATAEGRRELAEADRTPHVPNDRDK